MNDDQDPNDPNNTFGVTPKIPDQQSSSSWVNPNPTASISLDNPAEDPSSQTNLEPNGPDWQLSHPPTPPVSQNPSQYTANSAVQDQALNYPLNLPSTKADAANSNPTPNLDNQGAPAIPTFTTSASQQVPQPPASSEPISTFPLPSNNPTPQAPEANIGQISTEPNSNPPNLSNTQTPSSTITNPQPNFPTESAPTDLSQLTGSNDQPPPQDAYVPPVSSPENLVVSPTPATAESIKTSNGYSSKLPIFLVAGGVIVVLLVAAASAYFILGIGRPPTEPEPASVPAEQTPLTNPPKQIVGTPSPTPEPTPEASASGAPTFGGLTSSPSPTTSNSAIDRLRQRQSPIP